MLFYYKGKSLVDSAQGRLCFGNDVLSCTEIYIMLLSILLFHIFIYFIREILFEKETGT